MTENRSKHVNKYLILIHFIVYWEVYAMNPAVMDDDRIKLWKKPIPRENLILTKNTVVCIVLNTSLKIRFWEEIRVTRPDGRKINKQTKQRKNEVQSCVRDSFTCKPELFEINRSLRKSFPWTSNTIGRCYERRSVETLTFAELLFANGGDGSPL
ncbi:hypothetical protein ANN_09156 [Periplaneta americana]|uniref:Uncharacterized protein n=1 Tax=Periplaneta americana TaxID=6978 RepID=A0ABQ8TMZ4_PERAM|nr:hypothetical protein ANN_09156 [Periplaneta americana]